ncbi:MAG: hypothetical protein KatS3mg096_585 [Candidatus Parcubacteria bacterium]|nr:MAG: hypothetical protein KatS3mg096_585 [Candidatus Parcubacteria bacterium]
MKDYKDLPESIISIPSKSSTPEEWILWYDELKRRYGKFRANSIFLYAFSKLGDVSLKSNDYFYKQMLDRGVEIQDQRSWLNKINDFYANYTNTFIKVGIVAGIGFLLYGVVKSLPLLYAIKYGRK